jgi:hypothetical protein
MYNLGTLVMPGMIHDAVFTYLRRCPRCNASRGLCAGAEIRPARGTGGPRRRKPLLSRPPPLIPRQVLFGNPERSGGQISPDGRWLGYVAPDDGVLNVFVAPREHPDQAKVVTHDRKRGVRSFYFAYDGKHLLYPQDDGGNENFPHLQRRPRWRQADRPDAVQERARGCRRPEPEVPDKVLVNANDRNEKFFDPTLIDLNSGKRERLFKNDGYGNFIADDDFQIAPCQQAPAGRQQRVVQAQRQWLETGLQGAAGRRPDHERDRADP